MTQSLKRHPARIVAIGQSAAASRSARHTVPAVTWLADHDGNFLRIDWSRVVKVSAVSTDAPLAAKLFQVGAAELETYFETYDPEQAAALVRAVQHVGWIELQEAQPGTQSFADLDKVGRVHLGEVATLTTASGEIEVGRVSQAARRRVEAYLLADGTLPGPAFNSTNPGRPSVVIPGDADRLTRALLVAHSGGGNDAHSAFEELREAVCEYVGGLRRNGMGASAAVRELCTITRRTLLAYQASPPPSYFIDWIVAELTTWCLDEYYRDD